MSFLNTPRGKKLFNQFLDKFEGGSQKVYRSEIQQFFNFKDSGLSGITKNVLHDYQKKLSQKHSPKTTKRKFSMLNGFFKALEMGIKGFKNPISNLKEFKTHRGAESEELKKYLEGFIESQNTSNTKKSYENQIKLFFDWLGKDLSEISKADILSYRDHLREGNYKDSTIWGRFIALNRFFKFIERENRKFHNPIVFKELSLILPKKDKGYYKILSKSEAERLLKQPPRTAIGKRDRAILYLMLVYGLRANEVAKLSHKNFEPERVNGQQKVWIVDRKGKFQNRPKTAIILNGKALQAFDTWMESIKKTGIKITHALPVFLPFIYSRVDQCLVIRRVEKPKPLSVMAIENVVNKYISKAKIERNGEALSAHALRHTAFTMLAQAGLPIQEIQKLAGHADVNTTMIYIRSVASYKDHPGMHNPLNK